MAINTLEEKLNELGNKVEKLEKDNHKLKTLSDKMQHELERAQAYIEIQNLMSRYEYWHTAGQHDKKTNFIAQKTPGSRMEYLNSGVYEGAESSKKFLVDLHNFGAPQTPGRLRVHPLTTPVIEVAGDGKTARGVWISPGIETYTINDEPVACWAWETYAADFVKEDGIWKWLRIHLHRAFIIPYDKSWVDIDVGEFFKSIGVSPKKFPDYLQPDRPTTYFKMFSLSDTCCWTEGIPEAPEPYETYEEWMAVVPPPEK